MSVIAVDLDGTLAHYTEWVHHASIGEPIPEMVQKIKDWLTQGHDVIIFTARMSVEDPKIRREIEIAIINWCLEHIGRSLPVTATKSLDIHEIHDDRAVGVVKNDGRSHLEFFVQELINLNKELPDLCIQDLIYYTKDKYPFLR